MEDVGAATMDWYSGWWYPWMRTVQRTLARPCAQWCAVAAGFAGAIAVAVAALIVGPLHWREPRHWWFALPQPAALTPARLAAFNVVFYAGLATMVAAWLVVGLGVRAGHWRVRWLWGLGLIWGLPWLVAPVALSTDLYTYLAQGLVPDAGLDPYTHGPAAAGLPAVLRYSMSPDWLHTPTPYGPGFMGVDRLVAPLAERHIVRAIVLLRLIEGAGIALAAVCLPRVARRTGASPAMATWLGVVSPLMLTCGILSGHNDALMLGLVVAALAAAGSHARLAPPAAISLATAASLIKAPAVVALLVLTLAWVRRGPRPVHALARLSAAVATVVATATVITLCSALGTSWLTPAGFATPFTKPTPFTPTHAVSVVASTVADSVGLSLSDPSVAHAIRLVVVAAAGVFALLVLWRQPRLGEVRTIGLLLTAVVAASPTVWPWYALWPALLLAATPPGRARPAGIAVVALTIFAIRSDGGPDLLSHAGVTTLGVLVLLAFAAAAVYTWCNLIRRPAEIPLGRERTPLDTSSPTS